MQDSQSDADAQGHEGTATDGPANNHVDVLPRSSEQTHNLCAVRTHSLRSIEQSLSHPQPITLRHKDGPPKSSEINATTVLKARRVPTSDNEERIGCLSIFRYGTRRRAEPGSATKVALCKCTEHSAEQSCYTCSEEAYVPDKVSLVKDANSEESRSTDAQEYRYAKKRGSSLPSELAKQEAGNHFEVDASPRDWRLLERADSATFSPPSVPSNPSLRSPYDMRHGAVQPQYFCVNGAPTYHQITSTSPMRQSFSRWRASGIVTSPSPPNARSSSTISTSTHNNRRPLVDLTPQYRPPPQHRHKGQGYYPEQLGSGKLVDLATSLKKEASTP